METAVLNNIPARRGPELAGQTVVVIGGSSGIGLETARRARAEGARLILTGRDPERLRRAAGELNAAGTAAFDATDFDALGKFFGELHIDYWTNDLCDFTFIHIFLIYFL